MQYWFIAAQAWVGMRPALDGIDPFGVGILPAARLHAQQPLWGLCVGAARAAPPHKSVAQKREGDRQDVNTVLLPLHRAQGMSAVALTW